MSEKPTYEQLEKRIQELEQVEAERRRVKEALRESEERYRELFEAGSDAIFLIDNETGSILKTNQAAVDLYGYSRDELLKLTNRDLSAEPESTEKVTRFTPPDPDTIIKIPLRWHSKKDGTRFPVEISGRFFVQDGRSVHLASIRDITERRITEEVLLESEKRAKRQRTAIAKLTLEERLFELDLHASFRKVCEVLSETIQIARTSIWELTSDGNELRCLNLFNSNDNSHTDGIVLNARQMPKYFAAIKAESRINAEDVQNDPRTDELTESYLKPLNITSMLDAGISVDGELVGVVCSEHIGKMRKWHSDEEAFMSTITALVSQLLIETKQKQGEQELRSQKLFIEKALDSSPGIFYLFTQEGKLLRWNKNLETSSGYNANEISKMHPLDFFPIEDQQLVKDRIGEVFSRGESFVEANWLSKDGTKTPFYLTGVRIELGGSLCLVGTGIDISDLKRAEKALSEGEERYRNFVQHATEGIYRVDFVPPVSLDLPEPELLENLNRNAIVGEVNEHLAHMYGFIPGDMVGHTATEFAPNYGERALLAIRSPNYQVKDMETQDVDSSGQPLILLENFTGVVEDGHLIHVWGMQRDITERKQAEKALQESEERFSIAFKSNPAPLSISETKTGRFIDVNDRCIQLLEFSREELIGKTSIELDIWENPDDRGRIVKKLQTDSRFSDEPVTFRTKSGKLIHTVWSAEAIRFSGEIVMLSMFMDITEKKKAEGALKESQAELKNLIDAIPDMVWASDENECFTFVSESWKKITGYSPDELIGHSFYEIMADQNGDDKRDKEEFRDGVKDKFDGLKEERESYQDFLNWNIHKNGKIRCHSSSAVPRYSKDGKFKGYIGIDKDVTDRIEAEEEQKKLQEQLNQAQKMESIGRLAGGVAHDFNNMLSVILGNVELAQFNLEESDALYHELADIEKAALRSADLTKQLLGFARKQTIVPKVIDLNKIITKMLRMLQRLIGENIDLVWKPGNKPWQVRIDTSQMDQIFTNLLVNARDSIASHGTVIIETQNIEIDAEAARTHRDFIPGEFVMFSISDSGQGMDDSTLVNIFEPFFTTKSQGKGTGLGLSTVYGIVKQNNGFIHVYSELNSGTTFKIYLPRFKKVESVEPELPEVEEPELGSGTILLVEDEEAILRIGRKILESLGYVVLSAMRPSIALECAESHPGKIDLLITDVMMPEMNGRDLAKKIHVMYPELKTLYMSGYTANVIAHNGVLDEEMQFIQKPFSRAQLAEKVRSTLNKTS